MIRPRVRVSWFGEKKERMSQYLIFWPGYFFLAWVFSSGDLAFINQADDLKSFEFGVK